MPNMRLELGCSMVKSFSQDFKASLAASLEQPTIGSMNDEQLKSYLSPQPEDYIMVPFRALSATEVQGDTINFGHNNGAALKAAVDKFNGLVILKDHDMRVDNWMGKTQDALWDTSIPGVPPGVNFMLKVDTKADPKVARGLASGMLDSGSVTVEFEYDQSHPDMKPWDFMMALGSTVKGKKVQALVTSITRCYEYSVVWQGADSNAKRIKPDGGIDKAGLSETQETSMKLIALTLGLPETASETDINTAAQAKLAALTTLETQKTAIEGELATTKTTLSAKESELSTKVTEITTLSTKVTALETEKTGLATKVTELETQTASFTTFLAARRAEAVKLYKLAEGDKAMPAMETAMSTANLESTEAFIATFGDKADKAFPMECTSCHSTTLSRRKSQQTETGVADNANGTLHLAAHVASAVSSIHG